MNLWLVVTVFPSMCGKAVFCRGLGRERDHGEGGEEREREYPGIPKAYSILPFFKFDEMRQRMVLVFLSYFVRGFCYLQMLVYPVSLYIIWYVHILMNYSVKQYFCMNR